MRDAGRSSAGSALKRDFQPVVGGGDAQRSFGARDLLEALRVGEHLGDRAVVAGGLVVEQAQVRGARELAQLDADDVARMTPVGLDRDGVGERVHRIEDHEIRAAEELDEAVGLARILELVLESVVEYTTTRPARSKR